MTRNKYNFQRLSKTYRRIKGYSRKQSIRNVESFITDYQNVNEFTFFK